MKMVLPPSCLLASTDAPSFLLARSATTTTNMTAQKKLKRRVSIEGPQDAAADIAAFNPPTQRAERFRLSVYTPTPEG